MCPCALVSPSGYRAQYPKGVHVGQKKPRRPAPVTAPPPWHPLRDAARSPKKRARLIYSVLWNPQPTPKGVKSLNTCIKCKEELLNPPHHTRIACAIRARCFGQLLDFQHLCRNQNVDNFFRPLTCSKSATYTCSKNLILGGRAAFGFGRL